MKAITVWQPWATLLATGQKHNETRSWETAIDPNRTIGAIIPLEFCPWCGKEIKEAEDETEKENQQAE